MSEMVARMMKDRMDSSFLFPFLFQWNYIIIYNKFDLWTRVLLSSINTWSSTLRYDYMEACICHFNLRMIIPQKLMGTFLTTPGLMFELLLMVMNNKLLWKRLSWIELVNKHSAFAPTANWLLFFLKPNYFEKQCSSSSLLFTKGNNTGSKWHWSTQKASSMS